jgi:carboxyl-terminal processing protease
MTTQSEQSPGKITILLPLLLSLFLVGGMLIGFKLKSSSAYPNGESISIITPSEPGRLEELIRYIEARYVDNVDKEEMTELAIAALLKDLDPHSNYIPAKDLREVNEQLDGNFEGIGIEFMLLEDTILVVSPIVGGPSEKAGIMAGDKIVEVEDSLIAGKDINTRDVVGMLKGERGSKVKVGVLRGMDSEIKDFVIIRDKIPLTSVEVGYMLDDETGFIKISRFSATTYKEFMEKLEDLVDNKGMKNLVIDLRQNPGGYLQEATNILSQLFKEKNRLLVYTEGRTVKRNEYETTGRPFFNIEDIAVLIDEGSASASEIVAGAIQDWDRGVIIGRRSFGKGLVQEQYSLKDGSALRLTVARYYTPTGRSIQKSYDDLEAYDHDVYDRYGSGELYNKDSISVSDSTIFFTKIEKRQVFGGGGITPDIFIPLDTFGVSDYFMNVRGFIPQFVHRYVEAHQDDFNYSLKEFNALYNVPDNALQELIEYATEKEVVFDKAGFEKSKKEFKLAVKARIARKIYGDEGYFSVWNKEDEVVKKAVEALRQPNPLTYK